ncbi:hypothetical protein QTN47_16240 [Danxiaibacter flavus]|uniref:Alpha/beta hydrolase n=1 Tax=Danxiaibacter flavus TaxID=3049108 RepID=A0ABV3ZKT6_9BACT|nr:hypothetical protein QNM32_16250 [Chitinophagaceae bacterium DXS]
MRILILLIIISSTAAGQTTRAFIPKGNTPYKKYLFYLHGQLITNVGDNAINNGAPEWGRYEYSTILDSLQNRGFNIISERRMPDVNDSVYITRLANQVDTLLRNGVSVDSIIVVGASAGWPIGLFASSRLKNDKLHFVMMGGCWPDTYKDFNGIQLYGKFLSIIEKSDKHGTCFQVFENQPHIASHKELILNTGLSHGFFYKARKVWMDPVVDWLNEKAF